MSGGMSPSQLQQQLAQRQHEGAAQPLHSHPQIMQRPQSHGLEGGHQQQQHPQGLPRHLQQQQPLQFGGHPHQGPPGHPQQSHSHFPPHLQQQSQQQHMQVGTTQSLMNLNMGWRPRLQGMLRTNTTPYTLYRVGMRSDNLLLAGSVMPVQSVVFLQHDWQCRHCSLRLPMWQQHRILLGCSSIGPHEWNQHGLDIHSD